jgi:hypothetical protein
MLSSAAASRSGIIEGKLAAVESMPPTLAKLLLSEAIAASRYRRAPQARRS